ncbi:uncharacterized protein T551_01933 [Pneumocystis jirovecii RU7]|uniref:Nuclear rim protein 1 n=1 Tax=Pneumocystis jirovecii (strain RU7) TaxID=1408657 RepID=A0A0W4ZNN9_PNEJ7|nr:uncharacterized protein T551_01933 [Pneumocystis jirovecii RU7]KTW29989.1 hypothetical protein T551_01933 [Pneumocystis jirovecii RU7]
MTLSPGGKRITTKRLVRHSPLAQRFLRSARNVLCRISQGVFNLFKKRLRRIAKIIQAIRFLGNGLPVIICEIAFIGVRTRRIGSYSTVEVFYKHSEDNKKLRYETTIDSMEPPRSTSARCAVRDAPDSPSTPGFLMRFWRNKHDKSLEESTIDTTITKSVNDTPNEPINSNTNEHVWELSVWNPSKQLIYFFCFFNPVHLILLWYHPLSLKHLMLAAAIAFQLFLLHQVYAGYVTDKSIIHGEVFNEYSKKFVEPRLFPYKRDVATSTHPDTVQIDVHTPHGKPSKNMHQASVPVSNRIRSLIEDEWHTPSKTQKGTFKGFPMSPIKNIQPSPAKGFRPANSWSINTSTSHLRSHPNTNPGTKHF